MPAVRDGPVFAEPWQAQAFALTIHLHAGGAFTWNEWVKALSERLAGAEAGAQASRYYEHWLSALEDLVIDRGLARGQALADRKRAWADAFERTPHGQPVEL
jgi:nitrile hydratase accessory protein